MALATFTSVRLLLPVMEPSPCLISITSLAFLSGACLLAWMIAFMFSAGRFDLAGWWLSFVYVRRDWSENKKESHGPNDTERSGWGGTVFRTSNIFDLLPHQHNLNACIECTHMWLWSGWSFELWVILLNHELIWNYIPVCDEILRCKGTLVCVAGPWRRRAHSTMCTLTTF